jgi:hypothetical protein
MFKSSALKNYVSGAMTCLMIFLIEKRKRQEEKNTQKETVFKTSHLQKKIS